MKPSFLNKEREQAEEILAIRQSFFNGLLNEWSRTPELIDQIMGQKEAFLLPDFADDQKRRELDARPYFKPIMIKDEARGLLAVSVTPKKPDGSIAPIRWVYSILQAGDWIRFGLLLQGSPRTIALFEREHDYSASIEKIWDRPYDHQFRDQAGLMLEWRFNEPHFYNEFVIRERFLIISRHLHFRLGVVMNNVIEMSESESLNEISLSDSGDQ